MPIEIDIVLQYRKCKESLQFGYVRMSYHYSISYWWSYAANCSEHQPGIYAACLRALHCTGWRKQIKTQRIMLLMNHNILVFSDMLIYKFSIKQKQEYRESSIGNIIVFLFQYEYRICLSSAGLSARDCESKEFFLRYSNILYK